MKRASRFGVCSGEKAQALFVLAAIERHPIPHHLQHFAQTGRTAMAEDTEAAARKCGPKLRPFR
jgi:hypothetical protein